MTPENFTYWLQGFFEISQHTDHGKGLPEEAVEEIKNHLKLVFEKKAPTTPAPNPQPSINWPQTFTQRPEWFDKVQVTC